MGKSDAQKRAQQRYVERHPEKIREIKQRYEEKRGPRDRAAYAREYRRRQKLKGKTSSEQTDTE